MPGADLEEIKVSNTFLAHLVDGLMSCSRMGAREHDYFCMHLLSLKNVIE